MEINIEDVDFEKLVKSIPALDNLVKIASSNGNYNYDSYNHGLANGLILALSVILDKDVEYLDAPSKWINSS